jgi:hypothetical protein
VALYSGAFAPERGVTTTVNVTECTSVPSVAVTVTLYVPGRICELIVSVENTGAFETETGFTSNELESPDGAVTERVTSPVKPFKPCKVITDEPE